MPSVVFPSSLPGPSVSMVTPSERRFKSDIQGADQVRGAQRDYLGTQKVEWGVLSPSEALTLDTWWRETLIYGGVWFASTWPAPQGWVSLVRRFISPPSWKALSGGFWSVSATVQVRGRGLSPVRYDLDPYFGQVTLLVHGDGLSGGQVFTDSSQYHRPSSIFGAPTTVADVGSFGGSAIAFGSGSANYVSYSAAGGFLELDESYTIEVTVDLSSRTSSDLGYSDGRFSFFRCTLAGVKVVEFAAAAYSDLNVIMAIPGAYQGVIPAGGNVFQRLQIAIVKDVSIPRTSFFLNGVRVAFNPLIPAINFDTVIIGNPGLNFRMVGGIIEEVRITAGPARYTTDYGMNASAFPDG